MNYDITYCANGECPYTDCERHLSKVEPETNRAISIANLSGVCRLYIGYLVDEVRKEEK